MTTAHNIVPAPGPAFVRPSGGGGPTVRTKPWPEWAMLRAEEVREKLPPEQWGPWNHQGPCLVSNNTTGSSQMQPHPTEAPHFFYCRAHLQAIRARNTTVRPWPARDKGRCTSCGAPAAAAARHHGRPSRVRPSGEDQQHGGSPEHQTTTATDATPNRRRLCRGRICRETGQKRRVQPAGCCNITSTSRRRHCAKCCVGAAANRSAQVMPPTTIAAGTAARRTLGNERRARIRGLHCEGLDNRAIAHGLGVSVRTVPRALKAANDLATDRT